MDPWSLVPVAIGVAAAGRVFWWWIQRANAPPMRRMALLSNASGGRLRAAEIPIAAGATARGDVDGVSIEVVDDPWRLGGIAVTANPGGRRGRVLVRHGGEAGSQDDRVRTGDEVFDAALSIESGIALAWLDAETRREMLSLRSNKHVFYFELERLEVTRHPVPETGEIFAMVTRAAAFFRSTRGVTDIDTALVERVNADPLPLVRVGSLETLWTRRPGSAQAKKCFEDAMRSARASECAELAAAARFYDAATRDDACADAGWILDRPQSLEGEYVAALVEAGPAAEAVLLAMLSRLLPRLSSDATRGAAQERVRVIARALGRVGGPASVGPLGALVDGFRENVELKPDVTAALAGVRERLGDVEGGTLALADTESGAGALSVPAQRGAVTIKPG